MTTPREYKCPNPECEDSNDFTILGSTVVTCRVDAQAELLDSDDGDIEWGDDSRMECADCGHCGTVKDFEVPE